MTTKAGYYGSDAVENRFSDPKTNEAYFTLVNQKTGEIEVYNEEFGADKRVGTINKDGTVDYNNNWWGGANKNDKAFVEKGLADGSIKNHAATMVKNESDLTDAGVKELTGGNTATQTKRDDQEAASKALSSSNTKTNAAGSRTQRDSFGHIVFPEKIATTTQDIIKFNMMKYRPKDFDKETFGFSDRKKGEILGSVILPIPTGIADNQSVSWGQNSMNAVQAAMAQAALDGILGNPGKAVGSLVDSAKKVAANSGEASDGLARTLAGMAVGNNNLMTRTSGAVLNPNMELLFGGPVLRPFSFSFNLAPRNKKEGELVVRLIRFFKQGMAPIRSKSNLFLKSPHTFQLQYKYRGDKGSDHPFLNKFKECALQGFGVQYTPTGNYSTFSDGVMTQYQVTMSFTELEPIFNDDYGNDGNPIEIGF